MFYKKFTDGGFFRDGRKQEAKVFYFGLNGGRNKRIKQSNKKYYKNFEKFHFCKNGNKLEKTFYAERGIYHVAAQLHSQPNRTCVFPRAPGPRWGQPTDPNFLALRARFLSAHLSFSVKK